MLLPFWRFRVDWGKDLVYIPFWNIRCKSSAFGSVPVVRSIGWSVATGSLCWGSTSPLILAFLARSRNRAYWAAAIVSSFSRGFA